MIFFLLSVESFSRLRPGPRVNTRGCIEETRKQVEPYQGKFMKTVTPFLTAAFLFLATLAVGQEKKTVFENASLTKSKNGASFVQLNWSKGSENTAFYLLEKSTDGKAFATLALVFTADEAAWTAYNFRDRQVNVSAGDVYYRIALVNEKKELTYLPVVKLALSSTDLTGTTPATEVVLGGK